MISSCSGYTLLYPQEGVCFSQKSVFLGLIAFCFYETRRGILSVQYATCDLVGLCFSILLSY